VSPRLSDDIDRYRDEEPEVNHTSYRGNYNRYPRPLMGELCSKDRRNGICIAGYPRPMYPQQPRFHERGPRFYGPPVRQFHPHMRGGGGFRPRGPRPFFGRPPFRPRF
jgi:hypothetical protein